MLKGKFYNVCHERLLLENLKKMRSLGKFFVRHLRDYQKYIQIGGVGQETSEFEIC